MQTASIIKASAQIVRITELTAGDVYKRLEKSSYGDGDTLYMGIVTDVLHNGEEAAITACEFKPTYNDLEVKFRTWSGERDLALFPANPSELEVYLGDITSSLDRTIAVKERELGELQATRQKAADIIDGTLARNLSTPKIVMGDTAVAAIEAEQADA